MPLQENSTPDLSNVSANSRLGLMKAWLSALPSTLSETFVDVVTTASYLLGALLVEWFTPAFGDTGLPLLIRIGVYAIELTFVLKLLEQLYSQFERLVLKIVNSASFKWLSRKIYCLIAFLREMASFSNSLSSGNDSDEGKK